MVIINLEYGRIVYHLISVASPVQETLTSSPNVKLVERTREIKKQVTQKTQSQTLFRRVQYKKYLKIAYATHEI